MKWNKGKQLWVESDLRSKKCLGAEKTAEKINCEKGSQSQTPQYFSRFWPSSLYCLLVREANSLEGRKIYKHCAIKFKFLCATEIHKVIDHNIFDIVVAGKENIRHVSNFHRKSFPYTWDSHAKINKMLVTFYDWFVMLMFSLSRKYSSRW